MRRWRTGWNLIIMLLAVRGCCSSQLTFAEPSALQLSLPGTGKPVVLDTQTKHQGDTVQGRATCCEHSLQHEYCLSYHANSGGASQHRYVDELPAQNAVVSYVRNPNELKRSCRRCSFETAGWIDAIDCDSRQPTQNARAGLNRVN
jgi:hypothetical protein